MNQATIFQTTSMEPLKSQAIQIALTGNWDLAIELNKEIFSLFPKDLDTLNRLGFAYMAVGKTKEAKEVYEKVLSIDSGNPIAQKNLKRLGNGNSKNPTPFHLISNMFLEESGKTKVVMLVNTATPKVLHTMQVGQKLLLSIKRFKIFVLDEEEEYVGVLPDDIGKRLIKFIKGGNKYETYVKSVEEKEVAVFIRETKSATRFKNQPSFLFGEKMSLSLSKSAKKSSENEEE